MKKFLAIVLAGTMVLAMAGCSGGSDNSGESAASDSSFRQCGIQCGRGYGGGFRS